MLLLPLAGLGPECNSSAVGTYIHLSPRCGSQWWFNTPSSPVLYVPTSPGCLTVSGSHTAPTFGGSGDGCFKPTLVATDGRCLGVTGCWVVCCWLMAVSTRHLLRSTPCLGSVWAVLFLWGGSLWGLAGCGGSAPTRQASCPPCHIPRAVARSAMPPYRGIGAHFAGLVLLLGGPLPLTPHPGLGSGLGYSRPPGAPRCWVGASQGPLGHPDTMLMDVEA